MGYEASDEDELLRQIAGGDMRALEALYRAMRVPVFAVALAVAGDRSTAEDVMQDTFVRVYSDVVGAFGAGGRSVAGDPPGGRGTDCRRPAGRVGPPAPTG